ncbi:MAG: transposase [Flavobacteriales bacterium]|nr:MAG: transposase [Flavobacteriales bacterium]
MSEGGYKIRDPYGMYYLTFTVIDWIDVFTRKCHRDLLLDSFEYCQKEKGLVVHAYVIMSNHMHCILSSKTGKLSDTIRDFKSHTSKQIINSIQEDTESRREWMLDLFASKGLNNSRNKTFQFWQQSNHPIELHTNHFIDQKLDYIHNNPVKAGWVQKPEEYVYSSAKNYAGEMGLIEVELIL